jgi:transcriptional regulator with XRE-family HTH domain
MAEEKTIGEKIRFLRKSKGLSQMELSKKIGITYSHLSDLENQKSLPSVDTIRKLSRVLEVHAGYFFSDQGHDQDTLYSELKKSLETLNCLLDKIPLNKDVTNQDGVVKENGTEENEEFYRIVETNSKLNPAQKKLLLDIYNNFII